MIYDGQYVLIGSLLSIFGLSTWILPYENFAPNDPSWIISTLWFWYLMFPHVLPRIQRWSDNQLSNSIIEYFWLQMTIGFLILVGFGGFAGSYVSSSVYLAIATRYKYDVFIANVIRNIHFWNWYLLFLDWYILDEHSPSYCKISTFHYGSCCRPTGFKIP